MSVPRHADVLFLMVQYLQAKGLFASSLALQEESGVDVTWLRGYSREVALLRRWVFTGDVERARALLQPLQNLNVAPKELKTAQIALDELEILLAKQHSERDRSRLAKVKLKCFEKLVPLFRKRVDSDELDVFKYVTMPKLQLADLIQDAVLFHRQGGKSTARDCISVVGTAIETDFEEVEDATLLFLDKSFDRMEGEYERLSVESKTLAYSVDWSRKRGKRFNPLALSMNQDDGQFAYETDEWEMSKWQEDKLFTAKETADIAVDCRLETADIAVNCYPETKNAAVNCQPETTSVAVGCDYEYWNDAVTQTESMQEANFYCTDEKSDENTSPKDSSVNQQTLENNQSEQENILEMQTESDDNQHDHVEEKITDREKIVMLADPASPNFTYGVELSCGSPRSHMLKSDALEDYSKANQLNQEEVSLDQETIVEVNPEEQHDENLRDKMAPQRYSDLTLEDTVRASVIAEVREPQAVRALDMHPSGAQLVVGTNARALRVFDLPRPSEQRQLLASSAYLNTLLPLLPVALERHKHHGSGIYCASYNQYLSQGASAPSMIASGAADGSVKVLVHGGEDGLRSQQVEEFWIQQGDANGSMGKIRALEFASPHHLWVTSTQDWRIRCYDVRRTRKNLSFGPVQTLDGHVGEIHAIAIPDPVSSTSISTVLLSASLDKTVRLWDSRSGRCERLVALNTHPAFSLHFHPSDERFVASGHQDGSVALWDLRATEREALQVVVPHSGECRSVRWSPGGQWLLSAGFDGTLCVMQASSSSSVTLQPVASYHQHHGKVLQAQWHPTEPAFVSTGADKRVKLWAFT